MSNFAKRVLSALVFGALLIGGTWWHQYSFAALYLIFSSLTLWEFYQLTIGKKQWGLSKWVGLLAGMVIYGSICAYAWDLISIQLLLVIPLGLVLMPPVLEIIVFPGRDKKFEWRYLMPILGIIYITVPFALLNLIVLSLGSFEPSLVLGMLFLIWTHDSAAYVVGSNLGKTKLFERVSPAKTWEGTIGGLVFAIAMGYLLSNFFVLLDARDWMVIALIVGVFGTLGDLFESNLKRQKKVKDSGNIMPGHGGLLDRFDGFIWTIPPIYVYLTTMI